VVGDDEEGGMENEEKNEEEEGPEGVLCLKKRVEVEWVCVCACRRRYCLPLFNFTHRNYEFDYFLRLLVFCYCIKRCLSVPTFYLH